MNNLYSKFDEAKKNYEMKEEKKKKIIDYINLTDEIELRKYNIEFQKEKLLFFQKKIDFSVLNEDYYIYHDENNTDFFNVNIINKGDNCSAIVESMYILIPKNIKEKTLSLVIRRTSPSKVTLEMRNDDFEKSLYFITDLYCEKNVCAYITEYDFDRKMYCNLQVNRDLQFYEIKNLNCNYNTMIREYVEKNYLSKTLSFKISASEDYKKYFGYGCFENIRSLMEELIFLTFDKQYINLLNTESKIEKTKEINGYTVKYKVYNIADVLKAQILDFNEKCIGFVKELSIVTKVELSIIYNNKVVYNGKLRFIEEQRFNEKLRSYVEANFILNV